MYKVINAISRLIARYNITTVEPRLSKSLLSEPSVIRMLLAMNVEIPKVSSIFCKTKL